MKLFLALLLLAPAAAAQPPGPRAGDVHALTLTRDMARTGEGSSGSSHDRDTLFERVIGVSADGLELEYDLPPEASADDRARQWQLPARVFRPNDGPMRLLNGPELEARVEAWLKRAQWTREICGRWIFTWNAFRIDCDPQIVIESLAAFDLRSPAPVASETRIDAEAERRRRAEADVVLGELSNKPVTLAAALRERAKEKISGTVSVTFDTAPDVSVRRRKTVTRLVIEGPGRRSTETVTETLERRRVSRPAARR